MSITDELREWLENAYNYGTGEDLFKKNYRPWFGWKLVLEPMLDRIDEEHEKAVVDAYIEGTSCEVNTDAWVRLPVDADGVPIHAEDKMVFVDLNGNVSDPFVVEGFESSDMWLVRYVEGHRYIANPMHTRHYHEPTVEDVLSDFARLYDSIGGRDNEDELWETLLAEYATKLRLAGDDE